MKRKSFTFVLAMVMVLTLLSTSALATDVVGGVPNPMREATQQEILETVGADMREPDGSELLGSFIIESEDTAPMGEIRFLLDGIEYTYRIRGAEAATDISGLYYEFTQEQPVEIGINAGTARIAGDEVGVIEWYEVAAGIAYSLSMASEPSIDTLVRVAQDVYIQTQGDVG